MSQVYVRPFPNVGDSRFPISSGGGLQPLWGRDMKELFFVRRSGELLRVPIAAGGLWRAGSPEHLLDSPLDMSRLEGIQRQRNQPRLAGRQAFRVPGNRSRPANSPASPIPSSSSSTGPRNWLAP